LWEWSLTAGSCRLDSKRSGWRLRFYPAAAWFEDRIGARALTVKECVVRERTLRDDKARIGPTLENVLGARWGEEELDQLDLRRKHSNM